MSLIGFRLFGDGVQSRANEVARGVESDEWRGACGEAEDALELKAAAKAAPGLAARRVPNGVASGGQKRKKGDRDE